MKRIIIVTTLSLGIVTGYLAAPYLLKANMPRKLQTEGQTGKAIYERTCMPCHQADATGVPGMNPPLRKSPYVQGTPPMLIGIVLQGLDGGVDIEGETYSNPMPPFATVLKDQEIAEVLTYVRSHFGNKAAPISASLVGKIRQGTKKINLQTHKN